MLLEWIGAVRYFFLNTVVGNLLLNIVADILFLVLLAIIGGLLYCIGLRKLNQLFGASHRGTILVYLPVITSENIVTEHAVSVVESEAANDLRDSITNQPSRLISYLMELLGIRSRTINVVIRSSPPDQVEEGQYSDNLVLVGGPLTNTLTAYYLDRANPWVRFDTTTSQFMARRQSEEQFQPVDNSHSLAVLQKLTIEGQVIIFAFGFGENGTVAAVRYLASRWRELVSRHHDRDFAHLLPVTDSSVNTEAIRVFGTPE